MQNLNALKYNHPGGDFLAERNNKGYFITVKARNKFVQRTRLLNGGYNIFPEKVRRAAKEYQAIPAWVTIQLDVEKRSYGLLWNYRRAAQPKCRGSPRGDRLA